MRTMLFFFFLSGVIFSSCNSGKTGTENALALSGTEVTEASVDLSKIKLPPGFNISIFAKVPNARSLAMSPAGVIYAGNRSKDAVYAIVDADKNGVAEKVYKIASGMDTPNGVAFRDGNLYIATVSSIFRLNNIESQLASPPKPVLVTDKFPSDAHHGWKYIAFGPDGKLYVPVGDPSNISQPKNEIYSTITRMNTDGSGIEIFSRGIRNSVGFDWHPSTKELWFTDNGRDMLGDDVPGDELNIAGKAGMHFGHPFCHQGNIADKKFGAGKNCSDYTAPVVILDPHVAALGMKFYTSKTFGAEYTNKKIFIAEHGSWNRSKPIGYRVMTVDYDSAGKAGNYKVFAEGWLQENGKVIGRPVDILVMPDGALLVSDDHAGVIYRISRK